MGYYTDFHVTVKDYGEHYFDLDEELSKLTSYEYWQNGEHVDIKWYNHDKDMRTLSAKYPDALFEIKGEGEGGLFDIWIGYYRDGKGYMLQIEPEYPPFDEGQLE